MKCIILAAGYATRLYPLTENMPKALLEIRGKTMLDLVVEKVEEIEEIKDIYIVTNHRFITHFSDWAREYKGRMSIKVLDDLTDSNDNRLGAIGDIKFVIDSEKTDEDIFVLASDNIFRFSLVGMYNMYKEKKCDTISAHYVEDRETLKRMGVLSMDAGNRVTAFEEKPSEPKSNYGVPPFYFYRRETLPLIERYIAEGNNPDAPGHFIPWLIKHTDVYAYEFKDAIIDIGTPEAYEEAQRSF